MPITYNTPPDTIYDIPTIPSMDYTISVEDPTSRDSSLVTSPADSWRSSPRPYTPSSPSTTTWLAQVAAGLHPDHSSYDCLDESFTPSVDSGDKSTMSSTYVRSANHQHSPHTLRWELMASSHSTSYTFDSLSRSPSITLPSV